MKNKVLFLLLISTMAVNFSCRRGEEDPALSLRSRDNRLDNVWRLVGYEGTGPLHYEENGVKYTDHVQYSFSNNILTVVGPGYTYSDTYAVNMTINKDGTMSTNITDGLVRNEIRDSWFWLNSGKNKTKVFLGAFRASSMGNGEFDVVRLANKELKLRSRFYDSYTVGSFNDTQREDLIITFVAQ